MFKDAHKDYKDLYLINNSLKPVQYEHAELTTTAAECALLTNCLPIAREISTEFIFSNPQPDQFLCKAKLIFAQIIDIESAHTAGMDCITEKKVESL